MDDRRTTPWMEEDFDLPDDGSSDPFAEQPQFRDDELQKSQENEEWDREAEKNGFIL